MHFERSLDVDAYVARRRHVVTSSDHVVVGRKDVTSLDNDVRRRGAFWDDTVKLHSDFMLQHAASINVLGLDQLMKLSTSLTVVNTVNGHENYFIVYVF